MNKITGKEIAIHGALFLVTFITTTFAGAEWVHGYFYNEQGIVWENLQSGLQFSIPFLGILTVHEFGHYFAARIYKIGVTLPYYIPLWLGFIGFPTLGTGGAFIKLKTPQSSKVQVFDVGIAGPIAGFIAAIAVLIYGFTNLPPLDYLYQIHPEYQQITGDYRLSYPQMPDEVQVFLAGDNLLFNFLGSVFADPNLLPHPAELQHYPILFAGFWALVFTAMNLLPIGQLDGGHVLYGLFGAKLHYYISRFIFMVFLFFGGLSVPSVIDLNYDSLFADKLFGNLVYIGFLFLIFQKVAVTNMAALSLTMAFFTAQYALQLTGLPIQGYDAWLMFAFILARFLGIDHPPVYFEAPLDPFRKVIGVVGIIIFIISFTPRPLQIMKANEIVVPKVSTQTNTVI
jgi:membrane-associated protease RseP (regulator of RpoE activity)